MLLLFAAIVVWPLLIMSRASTVSPVERISNYNRLHLASLGPSTPPQHAPTATQFLQGAHHRVAAHKGARLRSHSRRTAASVVPRVTWRTLHDRALSCTIISFSTSHVLLFAQMLEEDKRDDSSAHDMLKALSLMRSSHEKISSALRLECALSSFELLACSPRTVQQQDRVLTRVACCDCVVA